LTIIALKRCIHKIFPKIKGHFRDTEAILAKEIDSIAHRNINLKIPYFKELLRYKRFRGSQKID